MRLALLGAGLGAASAATVVTSLFWAGLATSQYAATGFVFYAFALGIGVPVGLAVGLAAGIGAWAADRIGARLVAPILRWLPAVVGAAVLGGPACWLGLALVGVIVGGPLPLDVLGPAGAVAAILSLALLGAVATRSHRARDVVHDPS